MVLGLALAIAGGVLASTRSYSKVKGFQRISVQDTTGTVHFSHAGGYVAYYESRTVTDSTSQLIPPVGGTLTNQAANTTVILRTPYGNRSDGKIKFLHYDYKGHKGVALWQFHIDQPGTWQVRLQAAGPVPPDAAIAFGPSIAKGVVIGGILVVAGVVVLLGGLITLIVGLVRRRRHRREIRSGGFGGYGGFGVAPPASATGWPPASGPAGRPQTGGAGTSSPGSAAWPPPGGEPNTPPDPS
jgi:hypothetical protein